MERNFEDEALSTRILDLLKSEVAKEETKKKLKGFIDPVFQCVLDSVAPYIIAIVIILFLLLLSHGYIIANLSHIRKQLR